MPSYFVNKDEDNKGHHEVHTPGCTVFPSADKLIPLGEFASCKPAVKKAKEIYPTADGCWFCSRDCHRG